VTTSRQRQPARSSVSADADEQAVVRVVDDDPSFLAAVSRRLRAAGFVVEALDSAEAFLEGRTTAPGCVLLDLRLPHLDGLQVQDVLRRADDPLPVVFLTGHGDVRSSVLAMKRGAADFLTKPVPGDILVEAVRRAIAADAAARTARRQLRSVRARFETLTPREREVFSLVVRGLTSREISDRLGITQRTIKAHRAHIMEKMQVESVASLVRVAQQLTAAD
jgi:RNA polymerase sigma factor (sigma-70 family)